MPDDEVGKTDSTAKKKAGGSGVGPSVEFSNHPTRELFFRRRSCRFPASSSESFVAIVALCAIGYSGGTHSRRVGRELAANARHRKNRKALFRFCEATTTGWSLCRHSFVVIVEMASSGEHGTFARNIERDRADVPHLAARAVSAQRRRTNNQVMVSCESARAACRAHASACAAGPVGLSRPKGKRGRSPVASPCPRLVRIVVITSFLCDWQNFRARMSISSSGNRDQ